jgi:D-3-phosphoglycerate dehydrogenase
VKIIGRAGIGLDAIDMDAAREHGVAVFHTPDYATEEVATHALALILALNRRIVEGDAVARSDWPAYESLLPVKPLSEQVVGIVGLGRIGRAVIERLVPFRSTMLGFDPFVDSPVPGVERAASLDDLLTRADIVTLHLPVTPETVKVIGRREIGLLRPGALLINVSRGRLIDEEALVEALAGNRIRRTGRGDTGTAPEGCTDPDGAKCAALPALCVVLRFVATPRAHGNAGGCLELLA